MRRPSILATLAVALVAASLPATAEAASTYTQNALSVRVSGTTATVTANIKASPSKQVDAYGLCATDSSGTSVAFGERPAATIPSSGRTTRASVDLAAGLYTVAPCVTVGGTTTNVGTAKTVVVASTGPAGPKVLFSDDFTGTAGAKPDASRWGEWSACTYNGSAAYGGIKCGERSTLDGAGHLAIPATPTTGTSLSTAGRFAFTYGTMTARMKVPTEAGYWPAFWALNNNPSGQPNSATVGETDVIEAYTTFGDGYRRTTHNYTPAGSWSSADDPLCGGTDIRGAWHDYSAKIEPGQITFYFDGIQCGPVEKSTDPEAGGKPYAFGPANPAGNWLLLTLAIGGAGGSQKPAVAPAQLLVDQVTVTSL
ncbi:MAG: glycoside hydrolase family 16 protein [Janthinobacterium lividum]